MFHNNGFAFLLLVLGILLKNDVELWVLGRDFPETSGDSVAGLTWGSGAYMSFRFIQCLTFSWVTCNTGSNLTLFTLNPIIKCRNPFGFSINYPLLTQSF